MKEFVIISVALKGWDILIALLIVLCVILILVIIWLTLGFIIFARLVEKQNKDTSKYRQDLYGEADHKSQEYLKTQKLEDVYITNDNIKLHGYFVKGKSRKIALIVHGYLSDALEVGEACRIYQNLGYNVLMIDLRACGKSGGDYYGLGILDVSDLEKWISYLNKRFKHNCEIVLHGTSMGAVTILTYLTKNVSDTVKFAVADSPYARFKKLFSYELKQKHIPCPDLVMEMVKMIVKRRLKITSAQFEILDDVHKATLPCLFIRCGADQIVPATNFEPLYEAYGGPKLRHDFPNTYHALARTTNTQEYTELISQTLRSYKL